MTIKDRIVLMQGRVADRADGNIAGAQRLAESLGAEWGLEPFAIGTPAQPGMDDWGNALRDARPDLLQLHETVRSELKVGRKPIIVLPNDASSVATLPAVLQEQDNVSLVWLDAHADFNTPDSSLSKYLGGMPLSAGCGLWDSGFPTACEPSDIVIVGARNIDEGELELLQRHKVVMVDVNDVTEGRMSSTVLQAKSYIHLDLDVLEPGLVPTVYREPDGLTIPALSNFLRYAADKSEVIGLEISEFCLVDDEREVAVGISNTITAVSALMKSLLPAR